MKGLPSCPSCKGHAVRKLFASRDRMLGITGSFSVWLCDSCGMAFLQPFLSAKDSQKYYPSQTYYAYSGSGRSGLLQILREYLIAHYYTPTFLSKIISSLIHAVPAIPKEKKYGKVLDVGCGTGDTLLSLKSLGWDVYGMEMDRKAVAVCKKRGLTHIRLGTYEHIQTYENDTFDAIRLYHVIEHLPDPKSCLKLLYKKLKKGGEVIIGTPNIGSAAASLFGTYWYNLDSPRHLMLFTPRTLGIMAKDCGFRITITEYCSAGGIAGSLQYYLEEKLKRKINFINALWCIVLLYPIEWILDIVGRGDVFVMRLTK